MSEHIPSTAAIRHGWSRRVQIVDANKDASEVFAEEEKHFDRWLANRDAQIWDQAISAFLTANPTRIPENPFIKQEET